MAAMKKLKMSSKKNNKCPDCGQNHTLESLDIKRAMLLHSLRAASDEAMLAFIGTAIVAVANHRRSIPKGKEASHTVMAENGDCDECAPGVIMEKIVEDFGMGFVGGISSTHIGTGIN